MVFSATQGLGIAQRLNYVLCGRHALWAPATLTLSLLMYRYTGVHVSMYIRIYEQCQPAATGIQVYRYTGIYRYIGIQIYRCTGIQVIYTGVQIHRYTSIQVYNYKGIQVYKYTGTQVYRCTGIQVCQLAAASIQVYKYTNIQEYRYTGVPIYGYCCRSAAAARTAEPIQDRLLRATWEQGRQGRSTRLLLDTKQS